MKKTIFSIMLILMALAGCTRGLPNATVARENTTAFPENRSCTYTAKMVIANVKESGYPSETVIISSIAELTEYRTQSSNNYGILVDGIFDDPYNQYDNAFFQEHTLIIVHTRMGQLKHPEVNSVIITANSEVQIAIDFTDRLDEEFIPGVLGVTTERILCIILEEKIPSNSICNVTYEKVERISK